MIDSLAELSNRRAQQMFEEFSDIGFRDVWQKNDIKSEMDVATFWEKHGALPANVHPKTRVKQVCVIAYKGSEVVAVSTIKIDMLQTVRQKMGFYRAFVAPELRSQKILLPLTYAVHHAMERYALAHPELRLGGLAALVTAEQGIYKPVGSSEMMLIGYTRDSIPIMIRWFDHFRL